MKKEIINSVLSQVLFLLINGVLAIILVPILINMLGKIEYGAFELIVSLMIINFLLEFGLGSTLVKYIPEYKEDMLNLQKFIWSYFYLKLFITSIGCIGIIFVGYYFDYIFNLEMIKDIESIKLSVYIFSLGILFSSIVTFLENILKGFVHFGKINISKSISVVFFFLIAYGYYKFSNQYSLVEISFIWFIIRPSIFIFNTLVVFKRVKLLHLLIPKKFEYSLIKNTLHYLFGMSYITLVAQLYNRLPKIIFGILLNPIYVGYWGIIDRLKNPILNIQRASLRPLIPILSNKNRTELSDKKIFQASRLNYLMISFLGVLVIVNIDLIIKNWLSNDFSQVIELTKILFLPYIFPSAGVLLMMYYAKGKTKINQIYITLNTTISLTLGTTLLILYKDIIFFVYAYSFTIIILNFSIIFAYLKYFNINAFGYIKEAIVPIILLTTSSIILSNLLIYFVSTITENITIELGLNIIGTVVIYFLGFLIFMPKEDKEFLFLRYLGDNR